MLKLSPYRALVTWFLASMDIVGQFLYMDDFNRSRVTKGTNLCSLVQMSLVGLLVILLHVAALAVAGWYILVHPYQMFGWDAFFIVFGAVAVVAVLIGIGMLIGKLKSALERYFDRRRAAELRKIWEQRQRHREDEEPIAPPKPPVPAGPSILALLCEWLVATKKRFCPVVQWAEPISEERTRLTRFTLTLGQFLSGVCILAAVALVVHLVPYLVLTAKANFSVVEEARCSLIRAEDIQNGVKTYLQCGKTKAWSEQDLVATYFLNSPRGKTIKCSIYEDGEAACGF